jgi:Ca2+-binding RTX toxin-like protein
MGVYTGTNADEIIVPGEVSPTVDVSGPATPSNDPDTINAGGGDDQVAGGGGIDQINLGAGKDLFFWETGDGDDTVNGGKGLDRADFDGDAGTTSWSIGSEAGTTVVLHALNEVYLTGIESLRFFAGTGQNNVTINDMTQSSVRSIWLDMSGGDAPDGARDEMTIEGSGKAERITLTSPDSQTIKVAGLHAGITIKGATINDDDEITIKGYGGNDRIDASKIGPSLIHLDLEGGDGRDTILGSKANDNIQGEDGRDILRGGLGNDTLHGGFGKDDMKGGAGEDNFLFGEELISVVPDRIRDFKHGVDDIVLYEGTYDQLGTSVGAEEVVIGASATTAAHRLIYNPLNGKLFYDGDGDGDDAAVHIATLSKKLAIDEGDFTVMVVV